MLLRDSGCRGVLCVEFLHKGRTAIEGVGCELLLAAKFPDILRKCSEDCRSSLSVQVHSFHSGNYRSESASVVHSFQDSEKGFVYVLIEEIREFLKRHTRDLSEGLCTLEHSHNDLTYGCSGGFRLLSVLVEGGSHSEDLRNRDIRVRSESGKSGGKVHDIAFVCGRSHSQLIDSGTGLQEGVFQTVSAFQLEDIYQLSDCSDSAFCVSSEIFLQRYVNLVGCRDEREKILFPCDSELTSDTSEREKFVLGGSGVKLLQFLVQSCDFLASKACSLHRVSHRFVLFLEGVCSLCNVGKELLSGCEYSRGAYGVIPESLCHSAKRLIGCSCSRLEFLHAASSLLQLPCKPLKVFGTRNGFRKRCSYLCRVFPELLQSHRRYRLLTTKRLELLLVGSQGLLLFLDSCSQLLVLLRAGVSGVLERLQLLLHTSEFGRIVLYDLFLIQEYLPGGVAVDNDIKP